MWQDFAALRVRDSRHINVLLAHWTWRTYNVYLKSNRIASGIENYNEVTRLILGAPLDGQGLPSGTVTCGRSTTKLPVAASIVSPL